MWNLAMLLTATAASAPVSKAKNPIYVLDLLYKKDGQNGHYSPLYY